MKKYVVCIFWAVGVGKVEKEKIKNCGKVKKSFVKGLLFSLLFVIMLKGEKREREAL